MLGCKCKGISPSKASVERLERALSRARVGGTFTLTIDVVFVDINDIKQCLTAKH